LKWLQIYRQQADFSKYFSQNNFQVQIRQKKRGFGKKNPKNCKLLQKKPQLVDVFRS
jgi:hypothetical protein